MHNHLAVDPFSFQPLIERSIEGLAQLRLIRGERLEQIGYVRAGRHSVLLWHGTVLLVLYPVWQPVRQPHLP